jgi:hypothetical protein
VAPAVGARMGGVAIQRAAGRRLLAVALMPNLLRLTEEEYRDFVARGRVAQEAAQWAVTRAQAPRPEARQQAGSPSSGPQAKPRKRRGTNPETPLMDLIRRGLHIHPAVAWVVRMNSGQFKVGEGDSVRYVRAAFKGCPDLWGQMSTGELLVIEAKRPGEKPTVEQQAVLDRVAKHGGCSGAAHSVKEAIEIVEAWRDARRARIGARSTPSVRSTPESA